MNDTYRCQECSFEGETNVAQLEMAYGRPKLQCDGCGRSICLVKPSTEGHRLSEEMLSETGTEENLTEAERVKQYLDKREIRQRENFKIEELLLAQCKTELDTDLYDWATSSSGFSGIAWRYGADGLSGERITFMKMMHDWFPGQKDTCLGSFGSCRLVALWIAKNDPEWARNDIKRIEGVKG
jgi:hypothetical protein